MLSYFADFDRFHDIKMHHFLPLSKYEIVLFEILTQQLCRSLSMLHDYFAILV